MGAVIIIGFVVIIDRAIGNGIYTTLVEVIGFVGPRVLAIV